uniref:RING-type domain-containing protein n=1 Tax=viral metagenome TaxID=1070528 RepID=A0A6C0EG78_9ZZZZ
MPYIMLNPKYSDFESGSGFESGSSSSYNIELETFIKFSMHPALYFILSVVGLICLVCLCQLCSGELRIIKQKRNRNRNRNRRDSDDQSWDDFVAEMENHQDALAYAFVHQFKYKENNKTENSKRINKRVETQNMLNINMKRHRDKYNSFNFNDNKTDCCICNEKLTKTIKCSKTNKEYFPKLYMFPCGHTIHNECYKDYKMSIIVDNNTVFKCPICRS